jgi:hypothetical protein
MWEIYVAVVLRAPTAIGPGARVTRAFCERGHIGAGLEEVPVRVVSTNVVKIFSSDRAHSPNRAGAISAASPGTQLLYSKPTAQTHV